MPQGKDKEQSVKQNNTGTEKNDELISTDKTKAVQTSEEEEKEESKETRFNLTDHFNKMLRLLLRFEEAKPEKASKGFLSMYEALTELIRFEEGMIEREEKLSSFDFNIFREKCNVAMNSVDRYLKNAPGRSSLDTERLNAARSLRTHATDTIEAIPKNMPNLMVPKEPYIDAMKTLFGELKDTNSFFSRDSDEYKAIGTQVDKILNELTNTGNEEVSFDFILEQFKVLSQKTAAYRQSHSAPKMDPNSLSDRQKKRLAVFDKFDSFSKFIGKGDINPAEFEVYHGRMTGVLPPKLDPVDEFDNIPDDLMAEKDMVELGGKLNDGPEYIKPGNFITREVMASNSLNELVELRNNYRDQLSKKEIQYINKRIASAAFFDKLERKRTAAKSPEPVTKEDGTIILDNIHLDKSQSTMNGCYSCSFQLLLQSRGLNVTQQQIRSYRSPDSINLGEDKGRIFGDNMGNIIMDVGGIATSCLPNTAVTERTYNNTNRATPEDKRAIIEDLKKTIKNALLVQKSPVSLLKGAHYRTIVGYNERKGTVLLKDSWFLNIHNPNHNFEVKIEDLIKTDKLTLTHLVNVDPANPTAAISDIEEAEYVNGRFMKSDGELGLKEPSPKCDGETILKGDKLGTFDVQVSFKMPKELVFPTRMLEAGDMGPKVMPTSESPEKQALVEELKRRMEALFPKGTQLSMTNKSMKPYDVDEMNLTITDKDGNVRPKGEGKSDFYKLNEYLHYHMLIKQMDILTPAQVRTVLKQDNLELGMRLTRSKSVFQKSLMAGYDKGNQKIEEMARNYDSVEYVLDNIDKWQKMEPAELNQIVEKYNEKLGDREPTRADKLITDNIKFIIKDKQKALEQPAIEQNKPEVQQAGLS